MKIKLFLICAFVGICLGFEKPIVVVVLSYNNAQYYKTNLDSILSQHYSNYKVLYIDDASDQMEQLVPHYLLHYDNHHRVTYIRNNQNRGAMANHWYAVSLIPDESIVVICDGDDSLAHPYVLSRINQAYQDENVWMSWGQYKCSDGSWGISAAIDMNVLNQKRLRRSAWVTSHMRTYYAWLFKQIKLKDFFYQGNFLKTSCDQAIMLPLLEMAHEHHAFIPDHLYNYTYNNPLGDGIVKSGIQTQLTYFIRSKPPYDRLALKPLSIKPKLLIITQGPYQIDRNGDDKVISLPKDGLIYSSLMNEINCFSPSHILIQRNDISRDKIDEAIKMIDLCQAHACYMTSDGCIHIERCEDLGPCMAFQYAYKGSADSLEGCSMLYRVSTFKNLLKPDVISFDMLVSDGAADEVGLVM